MLALGLYLRPLLFLEDFFDDEDFLAEDRGPAFLEVLDDLLEDDRDEDFLLELFFEDFFAVFFVAMAFASNVMIGGRQSR